MMNMKKIQYWLSLVLFSGIILTACSENDPKIEDFESDKVAFIYQVDGDEYKYDYFYGATIAFTNTSSAKGSYTWEFGDGATSNEENPQHIYELPGSYSVTLTIDGIGKRTGKILISDIVPQTKYISSDVIPEIKKSKITLVVETPNPKDEEIQYKWTFPEGTYDENGILITESTKEDPGALSFNNVGSQQIRLQTTLGERKLEEVAINVNIGYSEAVKTLYYAVKGGNLMALKLINNLPADVKNLPFDLGVKSGQHPFNILFNDTSLYVLDAGRQFYFVNDVDGVLGDGRITVISKDGKSMEELMNNNGGTAFDDPFFGTIESGSIYYSDRNTGVSRANLSDRNLKGARAGNYWLQNTYLGYYGSGLSYGAIHATLAKYENIWWWAKYSLSLGIFRFADSDILTDGSGASANPPASGIFLPGEPVKAIAFDKTAKSVFVSVIDKGVYTHPVASMTVNTKLSDMTRVAELMSDTESTASERIYVCQIAVDETSGNAYFAYRAPSASSVRSGLKFYNKSTGKMDALLDGVEAYGVTINNTVSKLF